MIKRLLYKHKDHITACVMASSTSQLLESEKEELKEKVHQAAREGMAISIFALLWSRDRSVVKDVLSHTTEHEGQNTTPLIIAAMQGETKVVQVLLGNFDVNIEQRSTVRFDGYVIQDATALWCASGAGHLDIVELLIKNGANVNNSTATNSTPLRAACFDGRLDIVRYLLEHGADMTLPNKYDNTCLMISCYKGHTKVVRHLLEKGADPDLKAHCGATSLHFAAECGHLEVVKELVTFDAAMVENDLKMTPLLVAAECGKEDIVNFFLKQPTCSRERKIEALELLGASFANDKEMYSLTKSFHYLREAMILRVYEPKRALRPARFEIIQKPESTPVAAYGNHKECQNMQELLAIRNNRDALHMEALTIRERILGPDNPEIPHPIIFRGAVFADSGQFDRCIALWMRAMMLRQTNDRSIAKDLLRFSQVFSQMITIAATLNWSDVEPVLKHGLKEINQFLTGQKSESACESRSTAVELYQTNILSVIYLITVAFQVIIPEENTAFFKVVYEFLHMKPALKNGYSPLHIVLDPGICVDDFHVDTVVVFPDIDLAEIFLKCGADPNALDCNNNTPLHIIVSALWDKGVKRQDFVKLLLKYGTHSDIANKKRKTAFNLVTDTQSLSILNQHGNISLKCLASKVLREHNLNYRDMIPKSLESFVDWH